MVSLWSVPWPASKQSLPAPDRTALHAIALSGMAFRGNTVVGGDQEQPFVFVDSAGCAFEDNTCGGGNKSCTPVAADCSSIRG